MQLQKKKNFGESDKDIEQKLGSPEEIRSAAEKAKELVAKAKKERLAEEARRLEKERQQRRERERRRYCCGCCY